MAPLITTLTDLVRRTPSASPTIISSKSAGLGARVRNILPRATLADPSVGVIPPDNIPNKVVFVVFALIGVGFVLTGIWFFFWAKNGGFFFRQNDWDDYKTTVMRRKGPNGTTLSGATESTDLGGGSIVHGEKNGRSRWGKKGKKGKNFKGREGSLYKDFDDDEGSTIIGTDLGSEMSDLKWKEDARKAKKDKKEKKVKKKSRFGRDEEPQERDLNEEEMDVGVADTIRAYRHEKAARVGGLNKQADSTVFDGSTHDGSSAGSDLLSHREKTPTNTPTKPKKERNDRHTGGDSGIRKVAPSTKYPAPSSTGTSSSFWTRSSDNTQASVDEERIKAEAKKLQEKGRAAQRRDFSFQHGDDVSSTTGSAVNSHDDERRARREAREARRANRSPVKRAPGYYAESDIGSEVSRDTGTKSYHHVIPGLTAGNPTEGDYTEERRKKRNGGYRRDGN